MTGTGNPNTKLTETPAWAELANPSVATTATKPNRCFVFMEGLTEWSKTSSISSHRLKLRTIEASDNQVPPQLARQSLSNFILGNSAGCLSLPDAIVHVEMGVRMKR
jgi:hypothetical protein